MFDRPSLLKALIRQSNRLSIIILQIKVMELKTRRKITKIYVLYEHVYPSLKMELPIYSTSLHIISNSSTGPGSTGTFWFSPIRGVRGCIFVLWFPFWMLEFAGSNLKIRGNASFTLPKSFF